MTVVRGLQTPQDPDLEAVRIVIVGGSGPGGAVTSVDGDTGDVDLSGRYQGLSDSLSDISGLSAADLDFLQYVSGHWVNKTLAQVKTALAVSKSDVGLGNADNTSDSNKPVSTAQQTVLDLKAPLASPVFTGTPVAPTPTAADNTTKIATTAYVLAALSNAVTGLLNLQGNIDCSSNPNYPAGVKGDVYYVSVAGKIGGASGKSVDIGDTVICKTSNAGGTDASVGTSWFILEHNLVGALLSSNNLSDLASVSTARGNLGLAALALLATVGTAQIDNDSVTYAKIQNLTSARLLGRNTAGSGDAEELDSSTVRTLLSLVIGTNVQAQNTDLTVISGLTPANDDLLQRKAGAWINRTISQYKTDLALNNLDNTSDANKPVSIAQQTALDLKAPLNSPTFTGVPLAPTASPGTNNTQVATTAYADAIATLKATKASPTFTGIPLAPTASPGTNTTQIATTAYADAIAALKANIASPTFTGVPATPTASPGTNTTQLASTAFVTAAVALAVTGLLEFQSNIDCSANPNYPGANKGDVYYVSVAGKVGGASGKSVDIGDAVVAKADNAGGTDASVGASWFILEHNLVGALLSSNNLSDLTSASTARTNLGLGNLDNTADTAKPVSTAQQTALDLKSNFLDPQVANVNTGTAKTIPAPTKSACVFMYTMTGNCTFTMPTAVDGMTFVVRAFTGAGSFTGTFTGVKWPAATAPTLTSTAARMDEFMFASDGTNWYGHISGQNYTP